MRFAHPEVFWLCLLGPLLVLLLWLRQRQHATFIRHLGSPAVLQRTRSRVPALQQEWLRVVLVLVPFLSTILALADPRLPYGAPRVQHSALDVVIVIDVSKSMAAEDYNPQSRLAKARELARHLLSALEGNRVGLVTFAGSSFRQAELTEDFPALDFILAHWVDINTAGMGGSDMAQAIATGLEVLPAASHRHKLLFLFSDGGDGNEELHTVLTAAAQRGVHIVALGLGSLEPSRIPLYDTHHKFSGFLQSNGQTVTTRLNEAPLQRLAAVTNGTYRRVTQRTSGPELLNQHTVLGDTLRRDEHKIFQYFLLVGLLACGGQTLLARV